MSETGQLIAISVVRYKELLEAEKELDALHVGGVNNWQWYEDSLKDAGFYDDD